ncbi:MAG: peptidylprolyl isomerase [Porticoccaceae bacterium]|nr:peptidylprolyl isomerase [Porticoccaceae bacterium]MDG1473770.1 peptidylprolyl isomerase [Porticoccaceae bacterium]
MKIFKQCLAGSLLATITLMVSWQATAQIQVLDKVVAIVDDDVVLQSELNQRTKTIMAQLQQSGTQAPPEDILQKQILERLISERLQLTMGYDSGVRISDEELNDAIARIASGNQMTVEQYLQQLTMQGTSISGLKEEIRNELVIMRVQQGSVMRRIRISEQELDNFLNSEEGRFLTSPDVNIGQILLPIPSGSDQIFITDVMSRAELLLNQTEQGADFRALAIANSADQSALQGGDLGWRKMAQLPGVFIEAVEKLEPGMISQPIRSAAGLHLIKLYERRGGEKQLIEQHFARHMLIKPNQIRDQEATVSQLSELRQRVLDGEDFATLAKEFSEDPGSALNGGELGWSTPGMFVPEFEQVMGNSAINAISDPFQSQFGWHILQVTERRQQDFSNEIMENRAENMLRQRKYEEELQVWQQEIRDEAFVEIKASPAS